MDTIRHLGSQAIDWTDPDGRAWSLTFHFAEVNGTAEVVGLDVRGFRNRAKDEPTDRDGPHALTASAMRALPFGTQAARARRFAQDLRRSPVARFLEELGDEVAQELERQAGAFGEPEQKTRRTRWTTGPLREAATVYATAHAAGEPPTQAVADHFGISHSNASKVVRRARDQGFLPETTQGRAAGRPRNRGERT